MPDTQVERWFQDKATVGQQGSHTDIWAPVASRPLTVRDNRHDSAYIFGAVCPHRGVGAAMITPAANTEMMSLHLEEISTQVALWGRAVLVCDGAGCTRPADRWWVPARGARWWCPLVVQDNIVLLHLPPYSPELNPMENVWDYLRQDTLCAVTWDNYDAIVDACMNSLKLAHRRSRRHHLDRHPGLGMCQWLGGLL